MTLRVAVYARYSTDSQSAASIDDQIHLCRQRIAQEGWTLEQVYRDAAISGASTLRPGYQAMLSAAREGGFDVVMAEALDRLSRDQEDIAGLYKRLKFAGIKIVTVAEGEISELHIGLKGTMNALFLKDLAAKTHRGLRGRVAAGKSAGGLCFGYHVTRHTDSRGEPLRGDRTIDEAAAVVVNRVCRMFAEGQSPIAIAKTLNGEGIAGPGGRPWSDTAIRGHALRATGILRNELYIGRMVWNRMRYVKDPSTGKRISRMNPREAWVTEEVPHLRIIDDDLWMAVQARLTGIRVANGADRPGRPRFWEERRAQHLLSGKIFCAICGGVLNTSGRDYLACRAARKQATCTNHRSIRRGGLEASVIDALRDNLMDPEDVAGFIEAFTAEWNRSITEINAQHANTSRALTAVQRKIDRIIAAITEGFRTPDMKEELEALSAQKILLEARASTPQPAKPALHPNLAALYRSKVADLQNALQNSANDSGVLDRMRDLIERVDVGLSTEDGQREIVLTGALASMVRLGMGQTAGPALPDHGLFLSSVKVVAGPRHQLDLLLIG